jgi:hypothetical protein
MILAVGGVSAGALGFLMVMALVAASVLLFRSMNKQLRRVQTHFPANEEPVTPREDDGSV